MPVYVYEYVREDGKVVQVEQLQPSFLRIKAIIDPEDGKVYLATNVIVGHSRTPERWKV